MCDFSQLEKNAELYIVTSALKGPDPAWGSEVISEKAAACTLLALICLRDDLVTTEAGAQSYRMPEKGPEGGLGQGMANTTGHMAFELSLGRAHYRDL